MSVLNLKYPEAGFIENLKERFGQEFADVIVGPIRHCGSGRYFNQYFIQFTPKNFPPGIHFEYSVDGCGSLALHIEPNRNDSEQMKSYRKIGIRLMKQTADLGVVWKQRWGLPCGICWMQDWEIRSVDQLIEQYRRLSSIISPRLIELHTHHKSIHLQVVDYKGNEPTYVPLRNNDDKVTAKIMRLREVMDIKLKLPDYQRDYCWEDKNIIDLWNSLSRIRTNEPYHLGAIILHDYHRQYDIIDGQQRLITLTIILMALGYEGNLPLLMESYSSKEALDHISNCKFIVRSLVEKCDNPTRMLENIIQNVSFAVLIVNEQNLELAYTFFSNQNSKGITLNDFDLLKAHHLRFITDERQSEHLATKWNAISQKLLRGKENTTLLHRAVGTHLYRLRRWMRKNESEESRYRYIQQEYQAAPTMPAIPPFGETFDFYEKMQGGTHFFAYVDKFVHAYQQFSQTYIVEVLNSHLANREYGIFADVIETLLFGYYLKFGSERYMAEAFFCISQIMALYRYNENSVKRDGSGVRRFAKESELTLMIDQASSPTFFLAEALAKLEWYVREGNYSIISGLDLPDVNGIQYRIYEKLNAIWQELHQYISDSEIRTKIKEEYGQ